MVKHIVMWKIKGKGEIRQANCEHIRDMLLGLKDKIQIIRKIEVGINSEKAPEENCDVVLSIDFDTFDDLAAYQIDPEHKKVASVIGTLRETRSCIDYEF